MSNLKYSTKKDGNRQGRSVIIASGWANDDGSINFRVRAEQFVGQEDDQERKPVSEVVLHPNDSVRVSPISEEKRTKDRSPTHVMMIFSSD